VRLPRAGAAYAAGSVDEAFSKFALGAIRAEASTRPEKRVGPARGSRGRQHFQVAWEETEALRKALEAQLVRAINPNQTLVPPATAQLGAPIQRLCHIQPPGRKSRVHRDDARRGRWANARDGGAARTRRGSAAVVRACRGLATYAGGQAASPGRSAVASFSKAMRAPPLNELSQPHPFPSLPLDRWTPHTRRGRRRRT
jgi:hypothetical protein